MSAQKYISGIYKQHLEYKSFIPSCINKSFKWKDERINTLLEEAMKHLSELNAFSLFMPDIDFFIQMQIGRASCRERV